MMKFFVYKDNILQDKIHLIEENANHIINVLRYKVGQKIEVSSGDGFDYLCEICEIKNKEVIAKIVDCFANATEPKIKITVYQSLPKSEKMELIIQKCVEIGVDTIIPVNTDRTIVKLAGKENKKIDRWNKISEAAAKQSRRGKIPTVKNITSFEQAIKISKENDINFIPYEKEQKNTIKNSIKDFKGEKIGIFIGPEGGFSEQEIEMAIKNDILPITLGKRILRTETAGMVATTILLYELEE